MSGGVPNAATSTHAPRQANRVPSRSYQRERMNVFLNPAHKHQIDLLAVEWGVPLVEVVRRLLSKGLEGIMLTVPKWAPVTKPSDA